MKSARHPHTTRSTQMDTHALARSAGAFELPGPWTTIADIRYANQRLGHYWFDPGTMRFFRSWVESSSPIRGRFFVSSEQFEASDGTRFPREFKVRYAADDGSVGTLFDYETFTTKREAEAALEALLTEEAARV